MNTKTLLIVQTGSHLYGLANKYSDTDLYTIYTFNHKNYRPKRQAKQTISEQEDHIAISLDKFEEYLAKGVPQTCEVLFSKPKYWLEYDNQWLRVRNELHKVVVGNIEKVLDTYRRTVINFFATDDYKKNCHGFRLLLNALELKETGMFDPALTGKQIETIRKSAQLPWPEREDLFKDQLWSVFQ